MTDDIDQLKSGLLQAIEAASDLASLEQVRVDEIPSHEDPDELTILEQLKRGKGAQRQSLEAPPVSAPATSPVEPVKVQVRSNPGLNEGRIGYTEEG